MIILGDFFSCNDITHMGDTQKSSLFKLPFKYKSSKLNKIARFTEVIHIQDSGLTTINVSNLSEKNIC